MYFINFTNISIHHYYIFSIALYQAAILQSGSPLFFSRSNHARQDAFQVGKFVNEQFSSNDSTELLKVLQNASAEVILAVSTPKQFNH